MEEKIKLLHDLKQYPAQELQFLRDACVIVIQSRAVLKWTYAYGYFEMAKKSTKPTDKYLFEDWQTNLEKYCDAVHGMIERNLDEFLDPNVTDRSPFQRYKSQLVSYFEATKNFMVNMIRGIEEK